MEARKSFVIGVAVALGLPFFCTPGRADPPRVNELRVQKVGGETYFHVLLESPADLRLPGQQGQFRWWNDWEIARLPRLVPQDGKTQSVYVRTPNERERLFPQAPKDPTKEIIEQPEKITVEHLEFFGKVRDKAGKARFLLQYPTNPATPANGQQTAAQLLERQTSWVEVELTLDFSRADAVGLPGMKRTRDAWPNNNDLEGSWAVTQAKFFELMQVSAPEFGFYGFALETTGKKYTVPAGKPAFARAGPAEEGFFFNRQLYEITTGSTAITEALALRRLRNPNFRGKEEKRSIDIGAVQAGIVGQHPWAKLIGPKKPASERLARLIPFDNYYLHFENVGKLYETSNLFDLWGASLMRALQVTSRDYQFKERLEQQLCLRSDRIAPAYRSGGVKSIALTGSDPYLREGADLTVIFHVAKKGLILDAVTKQVQDARQQFGPRLLEHKQHYQDILIESCVSPSREVSMHQAVFDDVIVVSNALAGIRRVIDVHKGKYRPMAESPDFQYMRTVFPCNDPREDGFGFVSEGFMRNLAGPALRIKERRRLEALTSLALANNGALFAAWETGRLPASHNELLAYTGLKAEQLFSPDGGAIVWDAEQKVARSAFYNTLSFATPLIEIAIDRITPSEKAEYEQFRREYMGLWRQYFEPIGFRIKLQPTEGDKGDVSGEVRLEAHMLSLPENSKYNDLRRLAGGGTVNLAARSFHPRSVVQFLSHLSPKARERQDLGNMLNTFVPDIPGLNWLGDWFSIRLDDSPVYAKLAQRVIQREIDRGSAADFDEDVRLFFQIPATLGVDVRNPIIFAGVLAAARKTVMGALPGSIDWEALKAPYKGTPIVQIKARPDGALGAFGGRTGEPFTPSLYYAVVDGAWFLSLRQECIQDEIDIAVERRQTKAKGAPARHDVNQSLYASPRAAVQSKEFLDLYLEWETNRRAVANANLLYPLYRGKIVPAADDGAAIQAAALKYLGFIPVSPDYAPYVYDAKTDEVVNKRHGNLRRPHLHDTLAPNAPLAQLLGHLRSVQVDLQLEKGLHSVVTFSRK